ncbi:MAG: hypothetical protein J4432_03490 [DPANN group archaeon]|nr:hypothetical protein [DPANN group archaeon]
MGVLDFMKGKPKDETVEEEEPESESATGPVSMHECRLCGGKGADKKFGGMHWHKKCLRKARKMAKGAM